MQILNELVEGDCEKRMRFSHQMLVMLDADPSAINRILFGDEAIFHLNGYFNHQNMRYLASVNPHFVVEKPLHSPKIMVWCGLMRNGLVGPFFFEGSVTGPRYLAMLEDELLPTLDGMCGGHRGDLYVMQDGVPSHIVHPVKSFLEKNFPGKTIGRGLDIFWPPRSPDLTPCDYFLLDFLKQKVFARQPSDLGT